MPFVEYDEIQSACADCGRQFPSEEALVEHRASAHGPDDVDPGRRRVACSLCGRSFASVGSLADHNRRAHTN